MPEDGTSQNHACQYCRRSAASATPSVPIGTLPCRPCRQVADVSLCYIFWLTVSGLECVRYLMMPSIDGYPPGTEKLQLLYSKLPALVAV